MEIITFTTSQTDWRVPQVGALQNDEYLFSFMDAFEGQTPTSHLAWLDMDGTWFQKSLETYESIARDSNLLAEAVEKGWLIKREDAYWLAPVPRPGKLICIGLNYLDHAAESKMPLPKEPVIFSKFASAVIAPGEPVVLPSRNSQVDYEAELAVVIGRRAKNVTA